MKLQIFALLVAVSPVLWLLFRPRLALLKTRLTRAFRIAAPIYLGFIVLRLATSPVTTDELQTAGLWLAGFAAVWLVAWVITRSLARHH